MQQIVQTILLPLHVLYYLEITCFLFEFVSSLKAGTWSCLPLCPMPLSSTWVSGMLSKCLYCLGFQCAGALSRGCGSDPGAWQPAKTGGISVGHVGAKSQVHFCKNGRKSFVKESESIPATNYFWVILCTCARTCTSIRASRVWNRTQKRGSLGGGNRMRTLNLPKWVIVEKSKYKQIYGKKSFSNLCFPHLLTSPKKGNHSHSLLVHIFRYMHIYCLCIIQHISFLSLKTSVLRLIHSFCIQ